MSLFDPYSHTRIRELRQEQLARDARRRSQLGLDEPRSGKALQTTISVLQTITRRFSRTTKPTATTDAPAHSGRPALDS